MNSAFNLFRFVSRFVCVVLVTAAALAVRSLALTPQTITATQSASDVYPGQSVTFSASGGSTSYFWTGTGTANGASFTGNWSAPGTQLVTVQAQPNGTYAASNVITMAVTVQPPQRQVIIAGPATQTVVVGQPVYMAVAGGGSGNYSWSQSNGGYMAGFGVTSWSKTGPQVVSVSSPASTGFSKSNQVNLAVNVVSPSTPTIQAWPASQTIKVGQTAYFSAWCSDPVPVARAGFVWGGATGFAGTASQTWNTPGTYPVYVFSNNTAGFNTSNTVTMSVTVVPSSTQLSNSLAIYPSIQTVYAGEMAYFSASGGTSYSWSGANSLGGGAARMSWSVPGTYMVSVGSGGASQQATVIVTDQPQQQITASPLQTWIGAGQIAYFSANATGGDVPGYPVGYAWTNATPVASGAGAAWGRWSTPGTQIVSVYASGQVGAYAASPTLSLVVHVMPAGFNQNSASGTGASNFVASRRDGTMHQGGDPVELATGAYVTSHRLAFFPGPGSRPISIGYNSLLAATQTQPGIFGYGWTSEFEANLIPSGKNLVFNLDATHSTTFVPQAGSTTTFVCAQEGDEYDILKTNSGGGWTLTFRDQSELLFASSGLLAAEVDPHGRQLTVNRNGQNQITSITDSVSGAGLALSYGSNGCVSSVTDPLGGVVNLSYSSGNALITTISDQNAHPITFTYDSSGDLLSTTDGTGNVVVQNTYDGAGRVVSQQDGIATHPAATFSYQQNGLSSDIVTTMVDRSGSTWVYTYDPNYHLISLLDPDRSTISYTYDFYGNLTSCTDPVGNKQQFTYDASGNRLTATDAAGNTTTYSYDSHNRLLTAKDSLGNTVTYAYDLSNNVLSVTDANGKVTSWTYDANAQPLTRTLPNGGIYHFTYVGGYPATRTAPTGETTSQPSHRDRQSIVH